MKCREANTEEPDIESAHVVHEQTNDYLTLKGINKSMLKDIGLKSIVLLIMMILIIVSNVLKRKINQQYIPACTEIIELASEV